MQERKATGTYGVATANGFAMPYRARAGREENATYRKLETAEPKRPRWGWFADMFKKPQPPIASVLRS